MHNVPFKNFYRIKTNYNECVECAIVQPVKKCPMKGHIFRETEMNILIIFMAQRIFS